MPGESDFMTLMLITVFGLFLSDPTREYHEREVVRAEKRSKGSADKVLHVLAAQGFFSISRRLTAIRLFSLPCVSMRRLCSKALLERSAQYVARDIDELPSVCGTGCGSDLFPIQNLHPQTGPTVEVDDFPMCAVRERRIVSDTVLYRLSVSDIETYPVM